MKTAYLIFSFFIPVMGAAQTRGGAIFFRMTYSHVPHASTMLERLSPDSIGGFSNTFYGFGTDGFYAWNQLRLGFNAVLAVQGPSSRGDKYAEPMTGSAYLTVAYVVCNSRRLALSPHVGAGISGVKFTSYDRKESIISDLRSVHIVRPSIDACLNLDWNVHRFSESSLNTDAIMGFRLGYRYSGRSDAWKGKDSDRLRSPTGSFSNNAFYFTVALGIGVFNNKQ